LLENSDTKFSENGIATIQTVHESSVNAIYPCGTTTAINKPILLNVSWYVCMYVCMYVFDGYRSHVNSPAEEKRRPLFRTFIAMPLDEKKEDLLSSSAVVVVVVVFMSIGMSLTTLCNDDGS